MIELVIADLAAVLLAPDLKVKLLTSQCEKDGIPVFCYGDLPRLTVRAALKKKSLLQCFDGLLYEEVMPQLTSQELRRLTPAPLGTALWLRTPEQVDYALVLPHLSPRRRLLPRMLRTMDRTLNLDEQADQA